MTLTIRLDPKLEAALRRRAQDEGETLSHFIRKAIENRLDQTPSRKTPYELGKHLFGRRGSGKGDLSVRSREYFREYARAKHKKNSG